VTLEIAQRRRLSLARINRHAGEQGVAVARLRLETPVDRSRLFTCPSLAPLAHTAVFAELSPAQQRRYNQLVGLMQNEFICFFEQELSARVLPVLLHRPGRMPAELAASLRLLLDEERQHTEMFRRLNRLAAGEWYATSDYHVLRLPKSFLLLLRRITARPMLFPMVFWIMLLMEERSLMISRRYAAMDPDTIDPQFLATYRAHAEDEVRHVQIDWHLLEQLYVSRPAWLRRLNARFLEAFVVHLFLKPRRANVRLVDLLVEDFPALRRLRPRLVRAVRGLDDNPGYRRMMYSPEATPIGCALFDRLPELAGLRRRLFTEEAG
jgi:hypothetical protein